MEDDGHAAAAAAATAAFHGLDLEEDGEEDVLTPPETVMRKATEEFARTGTFPGVTPRFLRCAKGDGVEAKARWEETLQWRADEKINELLTTPQPFYDPIKTHYPHFLHFRSTNGCQVYYERVGHINLKGLHANGVTLDNLLSFYTFEAEFLYTYLLPDDDSQTITVIDCSGLTLRKLPGEAMRFIRTANSIMGRHYPERAFRVYIINAPIYFTVLWRAISVIIDPATLEKIHVTHGKNASLKALKEFIAPENIPKMYGGSCEVPFGESPEEVKLKDLVARLGQGTEQDPQ